MSSIESVVNHLNSFETEDLIAEFLRSKGAKGEMQDGESCVITNYILGETDAIGCSTTEAEIIVEDDNYDAHSFATTGAVHSFIKLFDQGYYPDLVDEREFECCEECG
jgi:hypothetical protein